MDAFLETAAKIPLEVDLSWNVYPLGIHPAPNTPLRIFYLHFACQAADNPSIDFYQLLFRVSATTLTELDVMVDGDGLMMKLADIEMPPLTLFTEKGNKTSRGSALAFISRMG